MKKNYKWLMKNGKVYLLHRTVGLFGEQWECFGSFDNKDCNSERSKTIIKLLNQCDLHTENFNEND